MRKATILILAAIAIAFASCTPEPGTLKYCKTTDSKVWGEASATFEGYGAFVESYNTGALESSDFKVWPPQSGSTFSIPVFCDDVTVVLVFQNGTVEIKEGDLSVGSHKTYSK